MPKHPIRLLLQLVGIAILVIAIVFLARVDTSHVFNAPYANGNKVPNDGFIWRWPLTVLCFIGAVLLTGWAWFTFWTRP